MSMLRRLVHHLIPRPKRAAAMLTAATRRWARNGGAGGGTAGPATDVDKRLLRKQLVRRLKNQQEVQRQRKSEAIRRKLYRLAVFRKASTVFCFVSLPYEVETRRLIARMLQLGKRVVVPIVRGRRLVLSELRDPERELAPGSFGVWEPMTHAVRPVSPDALELVLVPGVAFDHQGHRLGHGLGYFDRLLQQVPTSAPRIGLCFDFQLLERLPTRPHDQAVDRVLAA